jgi:hypothetical protein
MSDEFRAPRIEDIPDAVAIDAELGNVDVAFVIDATGSMGAYINEARRRALEEATRQAQVGALNVRFGLVAYRDHSDGQHLLAVTPLGNREALDLALQHIEASGGGDAAEAVFDGLNAAADLEWRPRSERFVFLIGDSAPHGYGETSDQHPGGCPCGLTSAVVTERLRRQNVRIDAVSIAAREATTRAFTEVAVATGGQCAVVNTPQEQTQAFAGTMSASSGSVMRARGLTAAMRADPRGGDAAWAASTGMNLADVHVTRTYLERRGYEVPDGERRSDVEAVMPPTTPGYETVSVGDPTDVEPPERSDD